MSVPVELELKLRLPAGAALTLRAHPLIERYAVDRWHVARIDNRYFDTGDRALAEQRLALRLRRIGRSWWQTLKASTGDGGAMAARDEWELPVAGPRLELGRLRDTPLAAIGSTRSLARRLQPLFTTNFRRESRTVLLDDGTRIEIAIDQGVIACGRGATRRSVPIREVELELKSEQGDASRLLRFARRLARDIALLPLPSSKAARGHRLAQGIVDAPITTTLPAARGDTPVRAHAQRVLGASLAAFLANLHAYADAIQAGATHDAIDPEFVHQARVAVRRLRSALRLFRPVIGRKRAETLDTAWQTIGHVLGDVRDWDVLIAGLPRLFSRIKADRAMLPVAEREALRCRAEMHRHLIAMLEAPETGAAALALEQLVLRLGNEERAGIESLGWSVPAWLDAIESRVIERARRIAVLDDAHRHRLRVEVKRLRYALDLVGDLYPAADSAYAEALTGLQKELGTLNDAVVAARLLRSLDAPPLPSLREPFDAWLDARLRQRLPKIGALAVGLELSERPWRCPLPADPQAPASAGTASA